MSQEGKEVFQQSDGGGMSREGESLREVVSVRAGNVSEDLWFLRKAKGEGRQVRRKGR